MGGSGVCVGYCKHICKGWRWVCKGLVRAEAPTPKSEYWAHTLNITCDREIKHEGGGGGVWGGVDSMIEVVRGRELEIT